MFLLNRRKAVKVMMTAKTQEAVQHNILPARVEDVITLMETGIKLTWIEVCAAGHQPREEKRPRHQLAVTHAVPGAGAIT